MVGGLYQIFVEPFSTNMFMRQALLAALLTVLVTSLVGVWAVLRGTTFLGDALAHGVLPGLALAYVLGVSTTFGALVAAALMIAGVNLVRSRSPLPEDVSIGVLFVGFLALGVVILSSDSGAYSGDLSRFLFGSVTAVSNGDLIAQSLVACLVVAITFVGYRGFVAMCFDETIARLAGLPVKGLRIGLSALMVLAIVGSFKTVGNLMVFAFLVAPSATAVLLTKSVSRVMALSVVIGSICAYVGLLISYHTGASAGAAMALTCVGVHLCVVMLRTPASNRELSRVV